MEQASCLIENRCFHYSRNRSALKVFHWSVCRKRGGFGKQKTDLHIASRFMELMIALSNLKYRAVFIAVKNRGQPEKSSTANIFLSKR